MAFLPVIMAVVSAVGAIGQMNSQVAQLKGEAQAHQNNADVARQNAGTAMEVANANEEQQRKGARQVQGEQRAAFAEAGTGLLSSTNQNLAVQSAKNAEQDALNIRYGGLLQEHGLLQQANEEDYQGKVAKSQIGRVRASGYLNVFSSALKGYSGAGGGFDGGMGNFMQDSPYI